MSGEKFLSKFTILCWAAFVAILGHAPRTPLLRECGAVIRTRPKVVRLHGPGSCFPTTEALPRALQGWQREKCSLVVLSPGAAAVTDRSLPSLDKWASSGKPSQTCAKHLLVRKAYFGQVGPTLWGLAFADTWVPEILLALLTQAWDMRAGIDPPPSPPGVLQPL